MRLTSYGESHGESIGVILDGFPPNFIIDMEALQAQVNRRRPGQSALTTSRNESDIVHINSGVFEGKSTGAPIHLYLKNLDTKPEDYEQLKEVFRPSHADYTYEKKYGIRDYRGGGRSSARITAAWVAAGALAQQYLIRKGLKISAYVCQIGVEKANLEGFFPLKKVDSNLVRCPDKAAAAKMVEAIKLAKEKRDSLGGVIQCVITNMPFGLGEPLFDKLPAKLAHAMMSINAVKGFEIGGGFEMAGRKGSEVNDAFISESGKLQTLTNHSGGVQGGISNGMDLVFRVAFKPTATIGKPQQTVSKNLEAVELSASGRHDPCVVPRAVPIVESMASLVILDALLLH